MHYHIVGIGGFGMSAIARMLLQRGHTVSGSDMRASALTAALTNEGATVAIGHAAENAHGADVILASTAVPVTNPEIAYAKTHQIPVYDRRAAMGILTEGFRTIAIAGTHGKTTTTALLTHVLTTAGRDPSAIVGGVMQSTGSNARLGKSDLFVIEADEYGDMFLGLSPTVGIVNNIEYDHPDRFTSLEALVAAFQRFVQRIVPHGVLIGGVDSPPVAAMIEGRQWQGLPYVSYSLHDDEATWFADHLESTPDGTLRFDLHYENTFLGRATLPMLGQHNVQNALAVCAAADYLEVPVEHIMDGLSSFGGTERRSELMARVAGRTIVNDYAHHPTAVKTTLAAWRPVAARLWAVWEPHTYTRMRALATDFVQAFGDADVVVVLTVYSVREEQTPGLSAPNLARMTREAGHPDARYGPDFASVAAMLAAETAPGDVIIIMSAGDGPAVGHLLQQELLEGGRS